MVSIVDMVCDSGGINKYTHSRAYSLLVGSTQVKKLLEWNNECQVGKHRYGLTETVRGSQPNPLTFKAGSSVPLSTTLWKDNSWLKGITCQIKVMAALSLWIPT